MFRLRILLLNPYVFGLVGAICKVPPSSAEFVNTQLKSGATLPFLARYRRDESGIQDETLLARVADLTEELLEVNRRRELMFKNLEERKLLTDELKATLMRALSLREIDDMWEPFKVKKLSLAEKGRQAGLEPLATTLLQTTDPADLSSVTKIEDGEKLLISIISEVLYRCEPARKAVSDDLRKYGMVKSSIINNRNSKSPGITDAELEELRQNFKFYDGKQRTLQQLTATQILAMFRGEAKGVLKLEFSFSPQAQKLFDEIIRKLFTGFGRAVNNNKQILVKACEDAFKHHVAPGAMTSVRRDLKDSADKEAILIFAHNMQRLLLHRPLSGARILSMDPGIRHGTKCVALDSSGNLLLKFVVNINDKAKMKAAINAACRKLNLNKIVIGDGTASREVESIVSQAIDEYKLENVEFALVSECGASVYSTSKIAIEELGAIDVLYRGSVSIGRRVLDPLSELVKIPVRSMGVGLYQHDVSERTLVKELARTTEMCVANVGVNVKTTNKYVLQCIPGLNTKAAAEIVQMRDKLKCRRDLANLPSFTGDMFTQVAGFLRFPQSDEPLDNTRIHPETYGIVRALMAKFNMPDISQREQLAQQVEKSDITALAAELKCGVETLRLVAKELQFPALDPRLTLKFAGLFRKKVHKIEELRVGDLVHGIVRNVTTFGAFVDIGVGHDGVIFGAHFDINTGDIVEDLTVEKIESSRISLVPADGSRNVKRRTDENEKLAPHLRPADLDVIEQERRKMFGSDGELASRRRGNGGGDSGRQPFDLKASEGEIEPAPAAAPGKLFWNAAPKKKEEEEKAQENLTFV